MEKEKRKKKDTKRRKEKKEGKSHINKRKCLKKMIITMNNYYI